LLAIFTVSVVIITKIQYSLDKKNTNVKITSLARGVRPRLKGYTLARKDQEFYFYIQVKTGNKRFIKPQKSLHIK
jgi:hypothetical protein